MVQRGYLASISVLSAHFFPSRGTTYSRYLRTAAPERVSHRFTRSRFETFDDVTVPFHSSFLLPAKPALRPGVALALGGGFARARLPRRGPWRVGGAARALPG